MRFRFGAKIRNGSENATLREAFRPKLRAVGESGYMRMMRASSSVAGSGAGRKSE